MILITTQSINNRGDWYGANAVINGRVFFSFMDSRLEALMDVLHQLAALGYVKL